MSLVEEEVPTRPAPALSVRILTTPEEVRALAPQWVMLAPGRSALPEEFLEEIEAVPTVLAPRVFAAFRGDTLCALLVGRVDIAEYRLWIARRRIWTFRLRSLTVVDGGALRRSPDVPWEPLIRAVVEDVRRGDVIAAQFTRVDCQSPLLDALRVVVPRLWRDETQGPWVQWQLDLPDTYGELLKRVSRHTRKHFRRWRERLEERFPGRLAVRRIGRPEEVPDFCRRADGIARRTYQRGMGAGFFHDSTTERILTAAARRGTLKAYLLEAEDRVLAFWCLIRRGNTLYAEFTAYDREFREFDPGTVLFLEVLQDAVRDGVERIDYGLGDLQYKRRFDATRRMVRDVVAFRPGARSLWIHVCGAAFQWIARGAQAAIRSLGSEGAYRRLARWVGRKRNPLAKPTNAGDASD